MGLLDSVFGGDEETERTSLRVPYNRDRYSFLENRLWELGAQGQRLYPGRMYQDFDPLELAGQQQQLNRANWINDQYLQPAVAGWRSALNAPDVARNPYVQGMLEQQRDLLNENLRENIMPGIASGAIGAGAMGGSRQGVAEGLAAARTQDAIGRAAAETQLDAYGKGLQQQQYGLGFTPTLGEMAMLQPRTAQSIGAQRRAMDERGLAEDIMRFNYPYTEPRQRLAQLTNAYMALTSPYDTAYIENVVDSGQGILGQAAGLALTGYGLAKGNPGAIMGGLGSLSGGGGGAYAAAPAPVAATPAAPVSYGGLGQLPGYGGYGTPGGFFANPAGFVPTTTIPTPQPASNFNITRW